MNSWLLLAAAFATASSLVLLIAMLVGGGRSRLEARIDELAQTDDPIPRGLDVSQIARTTLPKIGTALVPDEEEDRTLLRARLIHAGMYSPQAIYAYLGVKLLLMVCPAVLGLIAGVLGFV